MQWAGIAALEGDQQCVTEMQQTYQERRDVLIAGLRRAGMEPVVPKATFYVWCPTPPGYTSADFASLLLKECGIITTPGNGFGAPGEGYVRLALTVNKARIAEAVARIEKLSF